MYEENPGQIILGEFLTDVIKEHIPTVGSNPFIGFRYGYSLRPSYVRVLTTGIDITMLPAIAYTFINRIHELEEFFGGTPTLLIITDSQFNFLFSCSDN